MINLAEKGLTCDCGSSRLVPANVTSGELCICAACARTFCVTYMPSLAVLMMPVPWSTVESAFAEHQYDLSAFEWVRNGVPEHKRRPFDPSRAARDARGDRVGTVIGVALVLLVIGLCVWMVLS